MDMSGLSPDGITAFVLAYQEVTGGALTTELTPDNITAMVTKYLEAENVDISQLSSAQIEAIVSRFAEATGCDSLSFCRISRHTSPSTTTATPSSPSCP